METLEFPPSWSRERRFAGLARTPPGTFRIVLRASDHHPPTRVYNFRSPAPDATSAKLVEPNQDEQRWNTYLRELPTRKPGSDTIATAATLIWEQIRQSVPQASPPSARPDDDMLLVSWNRNGKYLEILVAADGSYEWSFTDPGAGVFDEGDNNITGATVPHALLTRIAELF